MSAGKAGTSSMRQRTRDPTTVGIAAVITTLTAVVVITIMVSMRRGLDLTDEGYYLLWARSPEDVVGVRNFGHYTGLLFALGDHGVWAFRVVGFATLATAAICFARLCEVALTGAIGAGRRSMWSQLATQAALLLGACGYYGQFWLTTPSYNWLVLLSLLVAASGALLGAPPNRTATTRQTIIGGGLCGASVVLAFMGKPPTAVLMVIAGALWTWAAAPGVRPRFMASSVAGALGVAGLHMVAFDPPLEWYAQLRDGHSLLQSLGVHRPDGLIGSMLAEVISMPGSIFDVAPWWWIIGPASVAVGRRTRFVAARTWLTPAILLALAMSVALRRGWHHALEIQGTEAGLVWTTLAIGVAAVALGHCTSKQERADLGLWPCLLACALSVMIAFMYGAASSNPLLHHTGGAAVFMIAATCVVARPLGERNSALVVCFLAFFSVALLLTSFEHPYRLPGPLAGQSVETQVGKPPRRLLLDPATASYLAHLDAAAQAGGFVTHTPLIDLTGASPGTVWALGGRAPISPWLAGGYPGSEAYVTQSLRMWDPALLASAWILTSPDGPRRVTTDVLVRVGLPSLDNFERVTETTDPVRHETQYLWRPRRHRAVPRTEQSAPEGVHLGLAADER